MQRMTHSAQGPGEELVHRKVGTEAALEHFVAEITFAFCALAFIERCETAAAGALSGRMPSKTRFAVVLQGTAFFDRLMRELAADTIWDDSESAE